MDGVVLTERELDVMDVLWERGSGTVAEVRERLVDDLAYTTVLTVLRTLEAKGHVGHEEDGRAHRYVPLVGRGAAREGALRRLTGQLFAGSTELLVAHLVSGHELSADQLHRVRRILDERLEGPTDVGRAAFRPSGDAAPGPSAGVEPSTPPPS